jgi:hypothetical protein
MEDNMAATDDRDIVENNKGLIDNLQRFKDSIAAGKHSGSEDEAFVMTKAINTLMDNPPAELEGAGKEEVYRTVVDMAARMDTRRPLESFWGTIDTVFGIPSTMFSEFPRRYIRKGLKQGVKETAEAYTGKRSYIAIRFERIFVDGVTNGFIIWYIINVIKRRPKTTLQKKLLEGK